MFLRPDPYATTRAVLTVQQEPRGWDELPPEQQRQQLVECFADAGWETPRVLEGLQATDDFYFHSIAQVDANRFSSGRCALTGDAAWAVMGTGTTLALVGPYVLAGELARAGDVTTALQAYDRVMREFVEKAHDVPKSGAKFLQPQTRLGIGLQHVALSVVSAPGIRLLTRRFAPSGDNLPSLPHYAELRAV